MARATLLKLVVAAAVIATVFFWLRQELKVDACLDSGGRWNSDQMECETSQAK
jgi:hypothetical protein